MRVLVVEDRMTLAERIAQGLRQAGMAVDAVHDGQAALDAAGPRIMMLTAAADVDVVISAAGAPAESAGAQVSERPAAPLSG